MNIIFLDFDGVLNTTASFYFRASNIHSDCINYFLEAVEDISKSVEIKIVISSSWRYEDDFTRFSNYVYEHCGNHVGEIHKLFSFLHEDYCTKRLKGKRGYEVKEWLSRHPEVERYICIDDDSDFLKGQPLLHTHIINGFSFLEMFILKAYFLQDEDSLASLKRLKEEIKFIQRDIRMKTKLMDKILNK